MRLNPLPVIVALALVTGMLSQAQTQMQRGGPGIPAGVDPQLRPVYEMVAMVTVASDLGVQASLTIAEVYPPEMVVKIQALSMQYNEMKKQRKDGNIDADGVKLSSDISAETANLDGNWQNYQKGKLAVIPKANKMLGLMMLADTVAALKAAQAVQILLNMTKQAQGNPLGMIAVVGKMVAVGKTVKVIVGSIGSQKANYKRVKGIVKNIAEAEKMTLAEDPPAGKVQDMASLTSAVTELDDNAAASPAMQAAAPASPGSSPMGASSATPAAGPVLSSQAIVPEGTTLLSISLGLNAPGTKFIVKVDGNKVVEEPLSFSGQLMQLNRTVKVAPGAHRIRVAVWRPPAQPVATEWDCQFVAGQNMGFTVTVDKEWNVTKADGSI